jgi:hypothetical protein
VLTVWLPGQPAMSGASWSITVTVNVQALVLPLVSVAVQMTGVTPWPKVDPLAGVQLTVATAQLSVATGADQVAMAVHTPVSVFFVISAGQVMPGCWVSLTITVKLQVLVLPAASVAAQLTVVVPLLKVLPLVGLQLNATPGQLSVALTTYVTLLALHWPASVLTLMVGEQARAGASVSFTMILNVQLAVLVVASVAVQLMTFVPLAKVEAEGGTQLTVTLPQLSEALTV